MEQNSVRENSDYEEIDLRDLVMVLIKHKVVIIFFTVVAALIAFGASISKPVTYYQVKMALEVGSLGDGVPVEGILQVEDKIDKDLYVRDKNIAVYPIKTANVSGSDIILVSAESSDRQGIIDFLASTGQAVITGHNKITAAKRQAIDLQIAVFKTNIGEIKSASQYSGQTCASEKYIAVANMENHIADLESEKAQISDTAIVLGPSASDNPIKSNLARNVALGAVIGLFIGIFTAFFVNWWKEGSNKK